MYILDYNAEILLNNDELLDWSGFSYSSRIGEADASYNVELNRPISISNGDTISISESFSDCDLIKLIDKKEIENRGGSTLRTSLSGQTSTIGEKAASKNIYFINEAWLSLVAPGYVFKNDILYTQNPGTSPLQRFGVSIFRLMNSELPGYGVKDHEFECRLHNGITHHDIGKIIADELGYGFYANTPNLQVQKTFSISSGETWWSAISRLFSIWNPIILVKKIDDTDTIFVLDQAGVDQVIPNTNILNLTEDSFTLYNYEKTKNTNYIDHIAITGPSVNYTYSAESTTINRRQHSKTTLSGETITQQFETTMEYDTSVDDYKYLYNVNIDDEREGRILRTIQKKRDFLDPQKEATIEEKEERWNVGGTKISEVTTTYEWADFNTPVSSNSVQYERTVKVGGGYTETVENGTYQNLPEKEWRKTKEVDVVYGDVLEEANAVEMDITEYGEITISKYTEQYDGEDYDAYDLAQPSWQARMTGYKIYEEVEDNEGWIRAWGVRSSETVRYDESSPSLLKKIRTVKTFFPQPTIRTNIEDIPLPKERRRSQIERRWEYFRVGGSPSLFEYGDAVPSGDFHPRYDLYVPDLTQQADAYKIAQRFFTLSQEYTQQLTIEMVVPLFTTFLGCTVNIPACTKRIFDWDQNKWVDVTLEAKSYRVTEHSKTRRYTGEPEQDQRELQVIDRLSLKEKF
jgi:hypothetical protein